MEDTLERQDAAEPSPELGLPRRLSLATPGGAMAVDASAGELIVRRDDGTAYAKVFHTSYALAGGSPERPITFLFNGGPGSASLWLNIGGFGPRRAPTRTPEPTPPAPYDYGDNPYSLLPWTDLVFLDAPETGYSRLLEAGFPTEVFGVDEDAEVFARAIQRHLSLTGRWAAPRFLFGESYGTTRAAVLVHRLQNLGFDFNGVILLSCLLDWARLTPGADQQHVALLPSFAATAHHHGLGAFVDQPLPAVLERAESFAVGAYASALLRGDLLPAEEERRIAEQAADLIGIDAAELLRRHLRVDMESFRRLLRAEDRLTVGRFDTRFAASSDFVLGNGAHDPATDDAATAGVNSPHLAGYLRHLREDLGFVPDDRRYRPLNNVALAPQWRWAHKAPGIDTPLSPPNVALNLSAAMRRNPALRVFVMGGVFDLATPYFGARLDIARLWLRPTIRQNVRFGLYSSGHMAFVDETAIARMRDDLAAFYQEAAER